MRIFSASLATESNSFSPIPTSRETFEQTMYFKPGEHPDRGTLCTGPLGSRGGVPSRKALRDRRLGLLAEPSARSGRPTISMRDEISSLRRDAGRRVLLGLTAPGGFRL